MKIRKILSDKWWIHPDNEDIDNDKWDVAKKAAYFETDFELPPLKEGVDPMTVQAFLIGSLTKEQYNQQQSLQLQGGQQFNPLWYESVIRYGVRDWRGLYVEENGKVTEIKPIYEDHAYGRCLTKERYDFLVLYCGSEMITIAYQIYSISSKTS